MIKNITTFIGELKGPDHEGRVGLSSDEIYGNRSI
jgi:hypothetical protein